MKESEVLDETSFTFMASCSLSAKYSCLFSKHWTEEEKMWRLDSAAELIVAFSGKNIGFDG